MADAMIQPFPRAAAEAGVKVRATARLHLGFLDLHGGVGRRFGSLGMALDGPETRISLRRASHRIVTGSEAGRAEQYLARLEEALRLSCGHVLELEAAIPAHSGLGSGTQLALAVGGAVRRLHRLPADPAADAALLARGARSGIGIALFQSGGFVVDGGRGAGGGLPPMIARLPVPEGWRVLLIRDCARQGLSGAREHAAFAALSEMSEAQADRLCRLAVMQVLPALAEADLARFGAAIWEIQRIVGGHFAPAQGGWCASPAVGVALERLAEAGAAGVGQTSWGPTGFAFAGSEGEAERLMRVARRAAENASLEFSVHRPLNRGAVISQ
jgi:beta-ribofuranosylaminobenzene 5'-phosphate synthase